MSAIHCAERAAPAKDAILQMTEGEIPQSAKLDDLTIIKKTLQDHFSKLRDCLEALRNSKPKEQGGCIAAWALDAATWERCIKNDFRELRLQLPRAVREKVEELIQDERLDALYFRRQCSDASGQKGVEEIFSRYVYNDPWGSTRQLGIEGLLRDSTCEALWPDWSQVEWKIKVLLDELDDLAKVDADACALRPLSDDDAIDGLVRILAPLEEDIRARHKDEDERLYLDALDAHGMLRNIPATGAYWKLVCEAMHDLWPKISYPAIKQAMRQAIRRRCVCTDRGDDFRFSSWVELPETKRGMGPVFSLTSVGKQRARQMGVPVRDGLPAAQEPQDVLSVQGALMISQSGPQPEAPESQGLEGQQEIAARLGEKLDQIGDRVEDIGQVLKSCGNVREPKPGQGYVFRCDGNTWELRFQDEHGHFARQRGFDVIMRLLQSPNPAKPVTAFDLLGVDVACADTSRGRQEVLDQEARRRYQARYDELEEEMEAAKNDNDLGMVAKCEEERKLLADELSKAKGLYRRTRLLGPADAASKVTATVGKRIERALKTVEGSM